jgi:hypothetical protein
MAQITDTDPNSNDYFFVTGLVDNTFKAGKNSFIINATNLILVSKPVSVNFYDADRNSIVVREIDPAKTGGIELAKFGDVYVVNIPSTSTMGIGKLEVKGTGIDVGLYTGSIAFFNNKAYPVSDTQRLPLIKAPSLASFPEINVLWTRNILIDPESKTQSEIRFFDYPYINVEPKIYNAPDYPVASYRIASGSCSTIAVVPKNNAARPTYTADNPIYQLYQSSGDKFTSSMEGEKIRIKNPYVRNFTYANLSNNQIKYEGVLNTDFIATIDRVVNETTLLLNIPFATVSDLIDRTNEDSIYNKSNLVDINGYTVNDDPQKQTTFFKKNFYVLSIAKAEYEIIHKSIPTSLAASVITGSTVVAKKSIVDIEFNNLRAYCGNVASYKVYKKSLNSPESKTLVIDGKVEADEHIVSNNFNNGLYNKAGYFFDQPHVDRFWLKSGSPTFTQDNTVLIDGVSVGHSGNSAQTDYIIFKDDTTGAARSANYIDYNLVDKSYWYAKSDAFLNSATFPTASYDNIANAPILSSYSNSQENLLSGAVHDSNPIKLRKSTLYKFSMRVRPSSGNSTESKLYVYFIGGTYKKLIGLIDSTFKYQTDELYELPFFSDSEKYGTIIFVPVIGNWYISAVSLNPYENLDYSIDSFAAKIPLPNSVRNELFELEVELYDGHGRLAYGDGSYTFIYNKIFSPLKKQIFIDPLGIITVAGSGGVGSGDVDGGSAIGGGFGNDINGLGA